MLNQKVSNCDSTIKLNIICE